ERAASGPRDAPCGSCGPASRVLVYGHAVSAPPLGATVRRRVVVAVAALLAAAIAAAVYAWYPRGRVLLGNVRGSAELAYAASQTPLAESRAAAAARRGSAVWGLAPERTRYFPGVRVAPPFRVGWTLHAHALIELPPAVAYGRLYFGTHAGVFTAADTGDGRIAWQRDLGECMA